VMEEKLSDAGAIASNLAADIYGGRILRRSIEDDRSNFTRFFLLGEPAALRKLKVAPSRSREYKTSLVFTTRNIPGALFRAISAFALRDLSLTKIESRPLRGSPWEYLFYVDLVGRAEDESVKKALGHLRETAEFLRVLGSYVRA